MAMGTACVALPGPAVRSRRSPIRGRLWDDLQEFRGKSPQWLPPPKGLSRQAAWGFTTHCESQPPPLLQKSSWQCFTTKAFFSNSKHALMHSMSHPLSWPVETNSFRSVLFGEEAEAYSRARGLSSVGESLCSGDGVTRQRPGCC